MDSVSRFTDIPSVLRRNITVRPRPIMSAEPRRGLSEIKSLRELGTIKVGVSERREEFLVLSQQLDKSITRIHLLDTSAYGRSTCERFAGQFLQLNRNRLIYQSQQTSRKPGTAVEV